jgi:hypothetical protein
VAYFTIILCAKIENPTESTRSKTGTLHANHSISAAGWSGTRVSKEIIMSLRFETAQRIALSFVGALIFASIAVSAATPLLPIA